MCRESLKWSLNQVLSCRLLDPNLSAESCLAHYVQAMKLFKREKVHEVGYTRESDMRGSTVLSYKSKERRGLVGLDTYLS